MNDANKATSTTDFWGTANKAFTAKEREAFNEWKYELYLRSVNVRDELRSLSLDNDDISLSEINHLVELTSQIPILEK